MNEKEKLQLVCYEIHDGLAQYLAAALMHFQACEQAADCGDGSFNFHEGLRLLRAATEEARRLIGGLRPSGLDEMGIVEAIGMLVADARVDVPRVEFIHTMPPERLPPDLETTILRIVQEALSNVRRHAHARAARVSLEHVPADDGMRVIVQDDGIGFDPAVALDGRFGIKGIRQRARLMGGESGIASSAEYGTTVTVTFPIMYARPPDG